MQHMTYIQYILWYVFVINKIMFKLKNDWFFSRDYHATVNCMRAQLSLCPGKITAYIEKIKISMRSLLGKDCGDRLLCYKCNQLNPLICRVDPDYDSCPGNGEVKYFDLWWYSIVHFQMLNMRNMFLCIFYLNWWFLHFQYVCYTRASNLLGHIAVSKGCKNKNVSLKILSIDLNGPYQ